MTLTEFETFLTTHPEVSYTPVRMDEGVAHPATVEDGTGLAFRVAGLPWYDNHPEHFSYAPKELLAEATPDQLWRGLTQGLEFEYVTRVTGYFAKVSNWNKGKLRELKDRDRVSLNG